MEFKISIALHIIGIVMWVGGLMILTRLFKVYTVTLPRNEILEKLLGRIYFGYVLSGLVLVLATGIVQLASRGAQFYLAQGWFHAKLGLVVLLLAITIAAFFDLRKIRSGGILSRGWVGALHGMVGLVLIGAVFLTLLNGSIQ